MPNNSSYNDIPVLEAIKQTKRNAHKDTKSAITSFLLIYTNITIYILFTTI